jgi:uncharacterized protein
MKVNGSATLDAPVERVWDALRDPAILVRTIPGCQRLETVGDDAYKMTVTAGVASIKGTYVGEVALTDPEPPNSVVLRARGQGAPGMIDATVRVRLSAAGTGTRLDYDADATVGGMIGGVGQRMLITVAKKTAGEFFADVNRLLTEPAAPALQAAAEAAGAAAGVNGTHTRAHAGAKAVAAGTTTGAGTTDAPGIAGVYTAPPASSPSAAGDARLIGAFVVGGGVALAGVLFGWLMGRRARR